MLKLKDIVQTNDTTLVTKIQNLFSLREDKDYNYIVYDKVAFKDLTGKTNIQELYDGVKSRYIDNTIKGTLIDAYKNNKGET